MSTQHGTSNSKKYLCRSGDITEHSPGSGPWRQKEQALPGDVGEARTNCCPGDKRNKPCLWGPGTSHWTAGRRQAAVGSLTFIHCAMNAMSPVKEAERFIPWWGHNMMSLLGCNQREKEEPNWRKWVTGPHQAL